MRIVAIWLAGLLASGIFGWLVDEKFLSTTFFPDGGPGMIGGMLAFVCVRLWLATPREGERLEQYWGWGSTEDRGPQLKTRTGLPSRKPRMSSTTPAK